MKLPFMQIIPAIPRGAKPQRLNGVSAMKKGLAILTAAGMVGGQQLGDGGGRRGAAVFRRPAP